MKSKVTFLLVIVMLAAVFANAQTAKPTPTPKSNKRPEVQPVPQADVDPRTAAIVVFNTPRLNENANNFLRTRYLAPIAKTAFNRQHWLVSGNTNLNPAWQGPRFTLGFVTDYENVAEKNLADNRWGVFTRAVGELGVEILNGRVARLPGDNNPVLGPAKEKSREVVNEIGRDALDVMGLGRNGYQVVFATIATLTRGDGAQYIPMQYGTLYLQVKRTSARLEGTSCFELNGIGTSPTNIAKLGGADNPLRKFGCTADAVTLGINEFMLDRFTQRGGEIKAYLTGVRDARDNMPRTECMAENLNLQTGKWECVEEATVLPAHQKRVRNRQTGQWEYVDEGGQPSTSGTTTARSCILCGKGGGSGGGNHAKQSVNTAAAATSEPTSTSKPRGFQFRKTLWYDKNNPMADLEVDMLISFLGEQGYYASPAESRPSCRAFDAAMELALTKFQRGFAAKPPSGYAEALPEQTGRLDGPTRAALNFMSSQGLQRFTPYTGGKICEGPAPAPTSVQTTPIPPVQSGPAPSANAPVVDAPPNLGHTGRLPVFQEIFFDGNPDHQMSGPNVEKVLAFLVNNENLVWNPNWKGITFGGNSKKAWIEAETAMQAAGIKGVIIDGRVNLAEWTWLNTQDSNLFKLTPEMVQSKAKAVAAPAPVKK